MLEDFGEKMDDERLHRSRLPLQPSGPLVGGTWLLSAGVIRDEVEDMSQPFLPLFFGDFLASTAEWSGEERALYLLCLAHQWSMGSLPIDPKRLAKLVDYERRSFDASWDQVSKKFIERDGRLYNLRLEQHRERSKQISEVRANQGRNGGIKSGETRRRKSEATASILLEANDKQTGSNGFDLASSKTEAKSKHPSHPIPSKIPVGGDDPKKAIFDLGVNLLGEGSRSLIGKAVSEVGIPKVSEVLGYLASHTVAEPKSYFARATQPTKRGLAI